MSDSTDPESKSRDSAALRYVRIAFSALLGVQLIALGVAAGSRAVFLNEFGLSLGQVGETTTDWIQRLTLVPLQAAFFVALYLLLTLPVPVWWTAKDKWINNLPPKFRLPLDPDGKKWWFGTKWVRQLLRGYKDEKRERKHAKKADKQRPKGYWWAVVSGASGPPTLVTLGVLALTDVDGINLPCALMLVPLVMLGLLLAVFGSALALDKGLLVPNSTNKKEFTNQKDALPNFPIVAGETVAPVGILLLAPIPLLGLAPQAGQPSPLEISSLKEVILWLLIVILLTCALLVFLKKSYYDAWHQATKWQEGGAAGGRVAFRIAGAVVLIVLVPLIYAQLYSINAPSELRKGHGLPANGLANLLHDGIWIYELNVDDSIDFPGTPPYEAAALAKTETEYGFLALDRVSCSGDSSDYSYEIGKFVWISNDKVESLQRLEP